MQVTGANHTGKYSLTKSYKDYYNYALFIRNDDGNSKRYVNKVFNVTIDEFIHTKALTFTGIKGTFSGTLYNEDNELDSLVITNGRFTFTTGNGAGHCDTYWVE